MNQLAELAAEGKDDGHNSSAADNPGAVYLGDGHNANVFAIGGVRRCAGKAADDVGKAVSEEGTGQPRVFDEVTVDDVACNNKVADVLSENNEGCRSDNHNRVKVEDRRIEMRQLEPRCVDDGLEVDHAHEGSEDIAADNAEENWNDAQKAAEGNGADDADGEREHGHGDVGSIDVVAREACHVGSNRSKLQADYGDDSAHSSRREDNVNPLRAYIVNDEGKQHEQQAENNEAGLRMIITGSRKNQKYGRDEGEARAQVGGNLALGDEDVQQRSQTVHEQTGGGADLEQKRNQHSRAEHGKQMLDTQGYV